MNEIEEILQQYGAKLYKLYGDKLQASRASGVLHDTMTFQVIHSGNEYSVVFYLQDYYINLEKGRGKNKKFPPIDSIIKWIHDKPIIPKQYTLPTGRVIMPNERQLAFLIGRKIARDGIPPTNYLSNSIEELQDELIINLQNALTNYVNREIEINNF